MSQGLIRRLTVLSQYEEALVKINATATERLTALKAKPQAAIQRDMLSICNDPFTVAQQLTHIELVRATQTFKELSKYYLFVFRSVSSCLSCPGQSPLIHRNPLSSQTLSRRLIFFSLTLEISLNHPIVSIICRDTSNQIKM